jgi:cytochrome c6
MRAMLAVLTIAVLAVPSAYAADEEKPTAEKFYASKCASCHGKDGKGVEKMAKMLKVELKELDLVDKPATPEEDAEFVKITLEGKKKMPAYKDKLKGLDPKELVKYIRGLKPAAKK